MGGLGVIATTLSLSVRLSTAEALTPSVYFSFDQGLEPDRGVNKDGFAVEGNVEIVEGKFGKAAKFLQRGDVLRLATEGNFPVKQGAIAFWTCPVDSAPDQRLWNPFIQISGPNETFNVVRMWEPLGIGGGLWRDKRVVSLAKADYGDWKPGTWKHVLYTWNKNKTRLFLDGKQVAEDADRPFRLPASSPTFTIGRPSAPAHNADGLHTGEDEIAKHPELKISAEEHGGYLLDDVALFDRFIGPTGAEAIFSKAISQFNNQTFQCRTVAQAVYIPGKQWVKFDIDADPDLPTHTTFEVKLVDSSGNPVGRPKSMQSDEGGVDPVVVEAQDLKPGEYSALVTALVNGRPVGEPTKVGFVKPEPSVWLNNTYGADDVVLPGFEPLREKDNKVMVWGRTYDFGGAIMPQQIVNQGKEMLAQPIQWIGTDGANLALNLGQQSMKLVKATDTRAQFLGKGTLGGLAVTADVTVEYDGFIKYVMTFDPGSKPVTLKKLAMEIPFRPEQSKLFFHPTSRKQAWPEKGTVWNCAFDIQDKFLFTLGTADTCLQWMTESDEHYYPRGNENAFQILNKGDVRYFKTNVIGREKLISKPFTLTFMLEAGPVKARPEGWRGWKLPTKGVYFDPTKHKSLQYDYSWWAASPGSLIPRDGWPENPGEKIPGITDRVLVTSIHFAGFRRYDSPGIGDQTPEWPLYGEEWTRIPREVILGKAPGWGETYVDMNSSYFDWHIYNAYQLFNTCRPRGLYYDDWMNGHSKNELAGSGYVGEDGIRYPTQAVLRQRELHRRIYAIVKKARPDDGLILIHTAGVIMLPVVAFCDVIYDGEVLGWTDLRPPKGNYWDTYKPSLMQTLFGKQYGPVTILHDMAWNQATTPESTYEILLPHKQRQFTAIMLLNDIQANAAFTSGAEVARQNWMDAFGIEGADVRFFPYWDDTPAARVVKCTFEGGEEDRSCSFFASAYTHPGKALVVIYRNNSPGHNLSGAAAVSVQLDRERLGLPSGDLVTTNAETRGQGTLGQISGDILTVPLEPDDFAAVLIEAPKTR
jgi:hypothetical protein